MRSPAQDIADVLVQAGVGTLGANLFIGSWPDKPDACVAVYDSGGFPPQSNYVYDYPTVQVQVRGAVGKYAEAYAKAATIKETLHDLHGESWGASWYIGIWAMSDILHLGHDETNRPLFSINFRIHRTDIQT